SILITVDSQNNQKGIELKSKLSKEIEEVLGGYSVEGAILSLSVSEDKQLTPLAEEYGISLGKAALVDLLVQQDVTLDFASIAKLSINDINLLIASKTTYNDDIESIGSASSGGYITVDRVKEIVFNDTGVNPAEVKFIEIDFDYDDGRMVYSVEFENNGSEYDYEIDATTGDIVEVDNHIKDEYNMEHSTWDNTSAPSNEVIGNEYIGNATAISIALSNAGLSQREISEMDCELDEDDGIMIYELEFTHGNTEYEYIINAVTGEIVEWEKK
ncbi:MAG: PepSY domain-containing protein, partial [Anaerotignaceae bacterium]